MNTITFISFIIFTGFTNQSKLETMTFGALDPNTPYRIQCDGRTNSIVRFSDENGQLSIPKRWDKKTGMHLINAYRWKYINPKPGDPIFQDMKN